MKTRVVPADERTTRIEGDSYRWAYLVLAFGVLLSVAYRGFILQQQSWDLLALVLLSGGVMTVYQRRFQMRSAHWGVVAGLTMLLAAVIATALVLVG